VSGEANRRAYRDCALTLLPALFWPAFYIPPALFSASPARAVVKVFRREQALRGGDGGAIRSRSLPVRRKVVRRRAECRKEIPCSWLAPTSCMLLHLPLPLTPGWRCAAGDGSLVVTMVEAVGVFTRLLTAGDLPALPAFSTNLPPTVSHTFPSLLLPLHHMRLIASSLFS